MNIRLHLDRLAGYLALWLIIAYVVAYGVVRLKGWHIGSFYATYATILVPIWLVDGFKSFFESFLIHQYHKSSEDLSKITVVVACKDGQDVIEKTLKDLLKRFRPDQVIVASNGSTDKTCDIARSLGVIVMDIKLPLGKVRAIHAALKHVDTPYVLLLDDDTLIGKAHMPTGLLDEGYEGVAFRVMVKTSTWVTKLQSYEYRKSTDIGKRYHNKNAAVQNISGAIGLFSLKQMRQQINRHTGEFSGEDLQRTMLIHLTQRAKGVVLSDSTVVTQPPSTLKTLFDQRIFGWYPGLYANFGNYWKVLTRDFMPTSLRADAFYNLFLVMIGDALRLLSLPILIFYPWYVVVTYCAYMIFEIGFYYRTGRTEPLWVVLVYPFYGLFNFITRACAFVVFLYRRLVVLMARFKFLDDFRMAKNSYKLLSTMLAVGFVGFILALNVITDYARYIINNRI